MNYSIVRSAADILTLARRRRLAGLTASALKLEAKASLVLGQLGAEAKDDLLTAWEGSLEESPVFVEEFQPAYSLEELLQFGAIDDDEFRRRLDAMNGRGGGL